jgi:hypothetical protein
MGGLIWVLKALDSWNWSFPIELTLWKTYNRHSSPNDANLRQEKTTRASQTRLLLIPSRTSIPCGARRRNLIWRWWASNHRRSRIFSCTRFVSVVAFSRPGGTNGAMNRDFPKTGNKCPFCFRSPWTVSGRDETRFAADDDRS